MLLLFSFFLFAGSELWRHTISDAVALNAVCNDGSPGVFYVEERDHRRKGARWLFFLQGGGGCYSIESCENRWEDAEFLMTSTTEPLARKIDGIFSTDCSVNPAFCEANVVYVHYCTSDWWSGDHNKSTETGRFVFHGKAVVQGALETLHDHFESFRDASQIVLAGCSAGGVGTWSNSDDVGDYVHKYMSNADYRVMSDVGWFLDGPGFKSYACTTQAYCNYQTRLTTGKPMWNLVPHRECGAHYGSENSWKCLVGKDVYPFIKAVKMAFVYQFDFWQALQDGVFVDHIANMTQDERKWVTGRGKEVTDSFVKDQVASHGVYAPGCFDHGMLPMDSFYRLKTMDGVTPSQAADVFVKGGIPVHIDKCDDVMCDTHCMRY